MTPNSTPDPMLEHIFLMQQAERRTDDAARNDPDLAGHTENLAVEFHELLMKVAHEWAYADGASGDMFEVERRAERILRRFVEFASACRISAEQWQCESFPRPHQYQEPWVYSYFEAALNGNKTNQ